MKSSLFYLLFAVTVAAGTPGIASAHSVSTGAHMASACTACHGTAGRSQGAIPSLAGMPTARFTERMQAFRQGEGTIMNRIVPAYDAHDIALLARYFAERPKTDGHEHNPR